MENNYTGIEFIDNNYNTLKVLEFIEKFNMYRIENITTGDNTRLLKDSDIKMYLSKQEVYTASKIKYEQKQLEILKQEQEEQLQEQKRIEIYNNDYGFTKNKSNIQKAKILKALNMEIYFDNKFYTRKDLIYKLINKNSYTKEYYNTNRYSKKKINLEYKKLVDKLEYRFYYNGDDIFLDITKTEYDFINYLLENELYNKIA